MAHPQMKMYDRYIALQQSTGCGAKEEQQHIVFILPIFEALIGLEAHSIPRNILSLFREAEQWKRASSHEMVGGSLNDMSTRALQEQFDEVAQLFLAHPCLRRRAARFDLHLPQDCHKHDADNGEHRLGRGERKAQARDHRGFHCASALKRTVVLQRFTDGFSRILRGVSLDGLFLSRGWVRLVEASKSGGILLEGGAYLLSLHIVVERQEIFPRVYSISRTR